MMLAGQTHEAVRKDLVLGHGARVRGDRIVSGRSRAYSYCMESAPVIRQ
jgi:hypothetical protein